MADLYVCSHGQTTPCDQCAAQLENKLEPIQRAKSWLADYDSGKLTASDLYTRCLIMDLLKLINSRAPVVAPQTVPATGGDEDREPNPLLWVVTRAASEPCRTYARGCIENQPDQSFWCAPCAARHVIAKTDSVGEERK